MKDPDQFWRNIKYGYSGGISYLGTYNINQNINKISISKYQSEGISYKGMEKKHVLSLPKIGNNIIVII